jgi:hypothetical protein
VRDSFILGFRFVDTLLFDFDLGEGLFGEVEILTVVLAEVNVGVDLFEDGGEAEFMAVVVFVLGFVGEMEGHLDFEELLLLVAFVLLLLEFFVEGEACDDGFDVHTFFVLGGLCVFLCILLRRELNVAEETVFWDYYV